MKRMIKASKYVVVVRTCDDDQLVDSHGVYSTERSARNVINRNKLEAPAGCYIDVEEVDPAGSFADDEPYDEY